MDRKYFKSETIKNGKKIIFKVQFENHIVDVENLPKEKRKRVYLDGAMIHESKELNSSFTFSIEGKEHKIDILTVKTLFQSDPRELAIRIDNIPVENTHADPYFQIKKGRQGLIFLTVILGIKIALLPLLAEAEYSKALLVNAEIYGIPFLIGAYLSIFFNKHLKISIFYALIIGVLEFVDFIFGIFNNPEALRNANGIIIWLLLRVYVMITIIRAFMGISKI